MGGFECRPNQYLPVQQGGKVEAAQAGGGGDVGEHGAGFPDILPATYLSVIVKITWPIPEGIGR